MTSAYILIVAILLLGGLIAALGDRIGTKVGKARLRLFQLRPKQTAILITIGTGTLISASTLIILFTLSESLRQGVFQLDEILKKRREITVQLETVQKQKEKVEKELLTARNRQDTVLNQLNIKENELSTTQKQVKEIQKRTELLRKEVEKIIKEKEDLLVERDEIQAQSLKLEESIAQRDQELQAKQGQIEDQEAILQQQESRLQEQQKSLEQLKNRQIKLESEISSRDEQITELDRLISQTEDILKGKEEELASLERQLEFYREEVDILEQYYQTYQDLRERPIAIIKGQVLTVTLLQIQKDTNVGELVDAVLNQANRGVMQILGYGNQPPRDRFVQITRGQVEQIKQQLSTPGQYLVRILSAGNYVQGEEKIRIFADVTPNQIVYQKNEAIASISIEEKDIKSGEIQEKLDFLISVSQFRARREGILGQIVIGDGQTMSLINFIEQLQSSDETIDEIFTVASQETYTSGPLQINLVAIADGKEMFRL